MNYQKCGIELYYIIYFNKNYICYLNIIYGSPISTYHFEEDHTDAKMRFFFMSRGQTHIVKVIEYSFFQQMNVQDNTIFLYPI